MTSYLLETIKECYAQAKADEMAQHKYRMMTLDVEYARIVSRFEEADKAAEAKSV